MPDTISWILVLILQQTNKSNIIHMNIKFMTSWKAHDSCAIFIYICRNNGFHAITFVLVSLEFPRKIAEFVLYNYHSPTIISTWFWKMCVLYWSCRARQTRRSGRLLCLGFNEVSRFLSKSEVLVALSVFSSPYFFHQ